MVFSRGFTPVTAPVPQRDYEKWLVYRSRGGTLGYQPWLKAGKPMVTRAEMLEWLKTAVPVKTAATVATTPVATTPTTVTATTGLGEVRVETINGILGSARYDENDNLIDFEPFPASVLPGAGVPQWRPGERELEQQQFAFQREQFEWQKQQAQQQIAQSYEDWRRRLLSELDKDRDWIQIAMIEQTPEKYPWQPPQIEMSDIQKSISQVEAAIAKRISDIKFSPQEFPEILPQLENLVSMEKELTSWKEAEANFVETQQPTIESIVAGIKGTPPAPGWLSQFAPGQVTGKPITKEQIVTPSGQQLTRLSPSQAGRLSGFAEWAKDRPWKDILAHAEIMQPFTPSGAGNRQWRPVSQGVV